ncbi:MAG TPA: alkaline phosphatase family protein, partial [Gemmatimonadaceae bacterium]|nr:alkaline phosphatase family protein [Gemmatimonadaceae bacterium]
MRRSILSFVLLATPLLTACRQGPHSSSATDTVATRLGSRLPTGVRLDPAAPLAEVGPMALAMRLAPERDRVVLSLSGYAKQGIQVVDVSTGRVIQDITQPAAFVGLVFSPDGRTLYASGGNQDVIYRYAWANGAATLRDSLILAHKPNPRGAGTRYPAGIAINSAGTMLYVAENLADSLAVIDLASGRVVQRFPTGRYPYDVVTDAAGSVFVSVWDANTVASFTTSTNGWLVAREPIVVARHPSALLLNARGSRLFVASGSTDHVAVVDTRSRQVIARLADPPPMGPGEGSTPNALALSADGTRLFVAEGDANSIGVFDLSSRAADVASAAGGDKLAGRVPTGWYPTAVMPVGDALVAVSGKGRGSPPNPNGPQPQSALVNQARGATHVFATLHGGFMRIPLAETRGTALGALTARVTKANAWAANDRVFKYPPFQHVVYIIKENRTYDQVLGDMKAGDGDSSLMFFTPGVSPNHHALAERFGLFDRFFVNAEVSAQGHNWSTAAYSSDYLEKTVQSNYSSRGRTYDYEGTNRGFGTSHIPDDDVNEPAAGYLWDLAVRKGITLRNYGEFVQPETPEHGEAESAEQPTYRGVKRALVATSNPTYPNFNLAIRDQHRADVWISELQRYAKTDSMPALEIVRLPNDHTSGAAVGAPTPRAHFADNDLALGRMIEALSRSPFWKNTVVFVVEDDAQNGPDHVDGHRAPVFVISPWSRSGALHRFTNTTDVLRTIEEILGLESLSQFDYFGR